MANRLVDDDARQPGCKARVRTECREMPKRAQIGLLHHVLGLSVIPDDRPCDPVEPLIVPSNDQAQRGRAPLPRETHEFGIDILDNSSSEAGCSGMPIRQGHGEKGSRDPPDGHGDAVGNG